MADQIQLRGGTAAESAAFTGASREVTVDTTNNTLRVHDGTTAGGHLLAKAADLTTTQSAQTAALSALGVSSGATSLGTFTGTTIGDNLTVKQILQAIETLLETKQAVLGTTASNLGTFTGSTIADNLSIKSALQTLETSLEAIDIDTDDLAALTGISENITNLGTFSGTTIGDNKSVKDALQDLELGVELKANAASPAFTGNLATLIGSGDHPVVQRIQGGFPDINLRTNGSNVTQNQNEGRLLWEDAGGGAVAAIKQVMLPTAPMRFFTGGITASHERLRILANGRIGIGETNPQAQLHVGGSVLVKADFPDFQMRSGGERRLIFEDAGGGAQGAIKFASNKMSFFAGGGIASGNQIFSIDADSMDVDQTLVLSDGLTLDSVALTTVQTSGESFADNDTSLMTSGAIADYVSANSGMAGVTATASELNILDGATVTTAEVNILDGVTATTAELNILDGVTATAAEINILDGVTSTAAELNLLDGVTATTAELNYVDGVTSAIQTQLDGKYATSGGTLTGSVTVEASYPDLTLKSNGERRLLFSDAGGSANAGLKYASSQLQFLHGGVAAGNVIAYINDTSFVVNQDVHLKDERVYFDAGSQLIRLSDNKTSALKIENHDGSSQDFLDFKTANSGCELIFGAPNQINNTVTVGEDDTGYDVKFFGATASAYLLWDESADDLILAGAAGLVVPDGQLTLGSTAVTSTAAELNILDGVTATTAEVNVLDGATAGTAVASKAVVLDSNKDITGIRNFTITGNLSVQGTTTTVDTVTMEASNAIVFEGATADDHETTLTIVDPNADRTIKLPNQSGCLPVLAADSSTAITATPEEINILDGVTSTAAELNILDGVTSTAAELNILDGVTSTAAELNLLDGVTATTAELNYVDGVTSAIQTQLDAKAASANGSHTGTTVMAAIDLSGDIDVDGTANLDVIDVDGTANFASTVEVNDTLTMKGNINFTGSGREIRFKNNTYNALRFQKEDGTTYMGFDSQGDATIFFSQPLDINTTVQVDGTFTVGVDDTGYDVKFFGATASAYMLWDESADDLILAGAAGLVVPDGQLTLGSTAVTATAAELNILDGVTATAAELNILDGVTATAAELNILDGVTSTAAELNILDGVTATAAELNLLDGVTATTAELNYVDGVTSNIQTQLDALQTADAELTELATMASTAAAAIADLTATEIQILDGATVTTAELNILDGVTSTAAELNILDGVTSTAAELNILDGVTSTAAELNLLDGITAGTVSASLAVIVDSDKDITGFRNVTLTGELDAATLDISGDADIDGTLNADAVDIDGNTNMAGNLTFSGGATNMVLTDNTAGALDIKEGTTSYMKFDTTDGSELITVAKDTNFTGAVKLGGTAITSTAAELNILDGVTATAAELNILDGVTATTAELNILDGVTATTAELNILDGVTSTAAELNILDGVTSTAAELNILDGVTATTAEINVLDGPTAGTVSASKAVVVDSNKDITGFRNVTATGTLTVDSVGVSAIQTSGESFSDDDTSLMTSAAIDDRIAAAAATETSGTWTATFRGSTGEPSTLKTKTGYYVKIGKMVTVTLSTGATDWSDYTGEFSITGLPATANANTHFVGTFVSSGSVDESNNNDGLVAYVAGNGTTITVKSQDYNNAAVNWSATSNDYINLTITYFTA